MPKQSAGLLLYRLAAGGPEVLLVHPGGPFYARKDDGVWSMPKGEHEPDEDPLAVALREFEEELGAPPPVEWAPRRPRHGAAEGRQARRGLVCRGRLRSDGDAEQDVRHRVAAPLGAAEGVPGGRPCGLVTPPRGARKLIQAQAELIDRLEALLASHLTALDVST